MRVGLVRNVGPYGHVHREDCHSKGYSTNCVPWGDGPYEVGGFWGGRGRPQGLEPAVAKVLAERGDYEGEKFCIVCLPDLVVRTDEILRLRLAAEPPSPGTIRPIRKGARGRPRLPDDGPYLALSVTVPEWLLEAFDEARGPESRASLIRKFLRYYVGGDAERDLLEAELEEAMGMTR